jgi:hypothetical protein
LDTASGNARPSAGKWLAVLATIAGLILGVLGLAASRGWWPFPTKDELRITKPSDDFVVGGPSFDVSVTGEIRSEEEVWIVARDQNGSWFPLNLASQNPDTNTWSSKILREQLGPPTPNMELHAVVVNGNAGGELTTYKQRGNFQRGLEQLPRGAKSLDSINMIVVK